MRTAPHGSHVMAQELSAKTVIEPPFHVNSFHSGTAQNAVRKKQDIHEWEQNLGPTHCFCCGTKWKQWRNQYGRVCRDDLLCSTRQRQGHKNGGHGEQREVAGTAGLRKKERTQGHAAGADACVVKSTLKHNHTPPPPPPPHTTTAPHTTHHTPDTTHHTPTHQTPPPPHAWSPTH